ncbi:hypothetical protein AEGHOMDF_5124 [Methylobacterium soli]|nr:hypothetical protein AEGHOMDF_5124 [Methylobacterium soli]
MPEPFTDPAVIRGRLPKVMRARNADGPRVTQNARNPGPRGVMSRSVDRSILRAVPEDLRAQGLDQREPALRVAFGDV